MPKAALNYGHLSVLAIYTTTYGEPFPAEMPLGADYCGDISWTTYLFLMTGMEDKVLACGGISFFYYFGA